jgi:hypothetical protein
LGIRLAELDARAAEGVLLDRNEMFWFLFADLVRERADLFQGDDPELVIQQFIRAESAPLFPSKKDLAVASASLLRELAPHRPRAEAHMQAEGKGRTDVQDGVHEGGKKRSRHRRGRGRRRPARPGPGAPQGRA